MQAKEYFSATASSSLFTSPNHLYYGLVSLATAIMLFRGTGEQALDKLRQDANNRSHGLEFTSSTTASSCCNGLAILHETYIKVLKNGHFINWYSVFPTTTSIYSVVTTSDGAFSYSSRQPSGNQTVLCRHSIIGKKYKLIDLIGRIPDLVVDLSRYGYDVIASRANYEINDRNVGKKNASREYVWRIHGTRTPFQLLDILDQFKSEACLWPYWNCTDYEESNKCIVKFKPPLNERGNHFLFPTIRETINNQQVLYGFEIDTHEMMDSYFAAFGLSMLSRYYPDLWIRCLESNCIAAKAIELFVDLTIKKGPLLALRFLSSDGIVISNHLPPWQT